MIEKTSAAVDTAALKTTDKYSASDGISGADKLSQKIRGKAEASAEQKAKEELAFKEDIVADVVKDFEMRTVARRTFESQWQLNANFAAGNQYCAVNINGEVDNIDRDYYWQEREVFNHIAPIVETRLAKLNRVRPIMSVRPSSNDDDDVRAAKTAGKILNSVCNKLELDTKIAEATYWSEICGSVFYKVVWDAAAGRKVGKLQGRDVFEGDVRIDVCPSYEIFPSDINAPSIDQTASIIHAKAVDVNDIKRIWDIEVTPERIDVIGCAHSAILGGLSVQSAVAGINRNEADNCCLVIERYTRPTVDMPDGELAIVAGGQLLYYGTLPYINGEDGKRELPFVKQDSIVNGMFFGVSMIERAIPIQRAYNAVKNRKHEFMNRIAMGVMTVEDGSVDTDNLVEEGLSPGKILVYRQGATPPRLLDPGRVPTDFHYEEDRLLSEFISVSGVSEIMRSSSIPSSLTSGVALQLLIEQDDTRLSVSAELIRKAIRRAAKHILRLYKQFSKTPRLARFCGEGNELEVLSWNSSDISSDDVVFDTENEMNTTPAAKQNMTIELLRLGLLNDENGKLPNTVRYKILDVLGYGGWEWTRDVMTLHINRAVKENTAVETDKPQILEIDDHAVHINEHTKYALSSEFEKIAVTDNKVRERLMEHIREHKQFEALIKETQAQ